MPLGINILRKAKHTNLRGIYFGKTKKWTHYDYTKIKIPHFVLYGKFGKPLCVLRYQKYPIGSRFGKVNYEEIIIEEIQRTSPKMLKYLLFENEYLAEEHQKQVNKNKKEHDKIKEKTQVHSSELLLKEFLFRNKRQILSGRLKISFSPPKLSEKNSLVYKTLLKKYFKKNEKAHNYELDLNKINTQKLLF